jgi:hypothetical protein
VVGIILLRAMRELQAMHERRSFDVHVVLIAISGQDLIRQYGPLAD